MRSVIFYALTLCVISGCATQLPSAIPADPSLACIADLESAPDLQSISARLGGLKTSSTPLSVFADKTYATPLEKAALSKWQQMRAACMELGAQHRASVYGPKWNAILDSQSVKLTAAMAELYQDRMTIGDFAAARSTINQEFKDKAASYFADMQEAKRRQQVDAAQSLLLMQAIQNSQPKPVYLPVPVAPVPQPINCTSQNVLGTVQTRCY